jgi:hypothetical protein
VPHARRFDTKIRNHRISESGEADQIVKAVRSNGGTAWHLLAENEGHGFHKKENVDYYFWTSLQFWQETLLNGAASR